MGQLAGVAGAAAGVAGAAAGVAGAAAGVAGAAAGVAGAAGDKTNPIPCLELVKAQMMATPTTTNKGTVSTMDPAMWR